MDNVYIKTTVCIRKIDGLFMSAVSIPFATESAAKGSDEYKSVSDDRWTRNWETEWYRFTDTIDLWPVHE